MSIFASIRGAARGLITGGSLTMPTGKLLGRSTAGTGAVESLDPVLPLYIDSGEALILCSAPSILLGRGDSGSGAAQEIALGSGLTITGETLSLAAALPVANGGTGGSTKAQAKSNLQAQDQVETAFTPPLVASFTAATKTTSMTAANGTLGLTMTAACTLIQANQLNYLVNTKPANGATGYYFQARFRAFFPQNMGGISFGLCTRGSGNTGLLNFVVQCAGGANPSLQEVHWTNDTTYDVQNGIVNLWDGGDVWLRFQTTSTNKQVLMSPDGTNWLKVYDQLISRYLTTDQVGICFDAFNNIAIGGTVTPTSLVATCLSYEAGSY